MSDDPLARVYWTDLGNGPILLRAPGAKVVLCAGRDGRLKTRHAERGVLVDIDPKSALAQALRDAAATLEE